VRALLLVNADPTKKSSGVSLRYVRTNITCSFEGSTPAQLLQNFYHSSWFYRLSGEPQAKLTRLQKELAKAVNEWEERQPGSVTIPLSVYQSLVNLHASKDIDCLTFCCSDGKEVTAHPCFLSASSPYFKGFFSGPWATLHPDRKWETQYTSELMTVMLSFVYTGSVSNSQFTKNCQALYLAAAEFDFKGLREIAGDYLVAGLALTNIKDRISIAHLHNDKVVLPACYTFVKANLVKVLMDPSFAALSVENPSLWKDLYSFILPKDEYKPYTPGN
jgi:BTB/POZ domain